MNKQHDNILIGVGLNLIGTLIGLLIVVAVFASYQNLNFTYFFKEVFVRPDYTPKILAICQVVNVPIFFYLLRKDLYKAGKGMILMFFFWVVLTLIYMFL